MATGPLRGRGGAAQGCKRGALQRCRQALCCTVFLERRSARFSSLRNADAEGVFARSCASAYIRSVITGPDEG